MTITVRCFEEDPYTVAVYVSDEIVEVTFDQWFAFQLRYDIETVNVHRSVNDPDIIYTLYSIPFSRSLDVIKALEELYMTGEL